MPFWTRLRPGKQPGTNLCFCNFKYRTRTRRLIREVRIRVSQPLEWPSEMRLLATAAARRARWSDYLQEPELPF